MNKLMILSLLGLALLAVWALGAGANENEDRQPAVAAAERTPSASARDLASKLKTRIHSMRRELIAGGPKVRDADKEALAFYNKKAESLEKRLYASNADLVSMEAEYTAALDATLNETHFSRVEGMARKAREKKSQLDELLQERKRIEQQRDLASTNVTTIRKRMDRRQQILDRISEGNLVEGVSFLPPFPDNEVESPAPADPFDRRILLDLARRDPIKARPIIQTKDPDLYWQLWPLVPPRDILKAALPFPQLDPPGTR